MGIHEESFPEGDPRLIDGRQSEAAKRLQRGVGRLLERFGFAVLTELTLPSGRRADVIGLGPKGELWIVEIKSSVADFMADSKWRDYRAHCDRLYFATHGDVPPEIFPDDAGFILADAFGGEILREAPEHMLPAATRKVMTLRFAQIAARRIQALMDPGVRPLML